MTKLTVVKIKDKKLHIDNQGAAEKIVAELKNIDKYFLENI